MQNMVHSLKIHTEVPNRVKYLVLCILYNQQDATCTMFFIIISTLHVSGGFSACHQELIKVYAQPWVLSCFRAVYYWCGWGGTPTTPVVHSRKA